MLKDKEIAVFNYITSRLSDGLSPSVREIMDAMGFKSTSTAHRYIETLVRDAYHFRMKSTRLFDQFVHTAVGADGIHLITVRVRTHHIQCLRSDRTRTT